MAVPTTGIDVLQMAMAMERTGKDFYDALALACDDAKVRQFCFVTAGEEAEHLATFQGIAKELGQRTSGDPASQTTAAELAATAKKNIQPSPAVVRKVAINGNLKEAVTMAIQMEQDAVQFYQGLIALLPDSAPAIHRIVEEEKAHVHRLRFLLS